MKDYRQAIKDKKRIVVKSGSSSLQHAATGDLDYIRMDVLVRELCNLRNQGRDVVLVTSGAIAAGKKRCGRTRRRPHKTPSPSNRPAPRSGRPG